MSYTQADFRFLRRRLTQTTTFVSQSTYVIQSSYWLTVFSLRGASALFDLAQFISLLYVWFKTKIFGRTPREIREVCIGTSAQHQLTC